MTPTARNAAIAAAATLIPAAIAAAMYPDRARALPGRIVDRSRDLFESDDIDSQMRRALARLDHLTDGLDRYTGRNQPQFSTGTLVAAGIAAAIAIPAALTAIFAPDRVRAARDSVVGYFSEEDEAEMQSELSRVSERLDALNSDIEAQRERAFDAVTGAAQSPQV